jgi:hypothetical protein
MLMRAIEVDLDMIKCLPSLWLQKRAVQCVVPISSSTKERVIWIGSAQIAAHSKFGQTEVTMARRPIWRNPEMVKLARQLIERQEGKSPNAVSAKPSRRKSAAATSKSTKRPAARKRA